LPANWCTPWNRRIRSDLRSVTSPSAARLLALRAQKHPAIQHYIPAQFDLHGLSPVAWKHISDLTLNTTSATSFFKRPGCQFPARHTALTNLRPGAYNKALHSGSSCRDSAQWGASTAVSIKRPNSPRLPAPTSPSQTGIVKSALINSTHPRSDPRSSLKDQHASCIASNQQYCRPFPLQSSGPLSNFQQPIFSGPLARRNIDKKKKKNGRSSCASISSGTPHARAISRQLRRQRPTPDSLQCKLTITGLYLCVARHASLQTDSIARSPTPGKANLPDLPTQRGMSAIDWKGRYNAPGRPPLSTHINPYYPHPPARARLQRHRFTARTGRWIPSPYSPLLWKFLPSAKRPDTVGGPSSALTTAIAMTRQSRSKPPASFGTQFCMISAITRVPATAACDMTLPNPRRWLTQWMTLLYKTAVYGTVRMTTLQPPSS